MVGYLKGFTRGFYEEIKVSVTTTVVEYLFNVHPDEKIELLNEEREKSSHKMIYRLRPRCVISSKYTQATILLLTTHVWEP